jgi:hypothetical protein
MPVEYGRDDPASTAVTAVAPVTVGEALAFANGNPRMALAVPVVVDLRVLRASCPNPASQIQSRRSEQSPHALSAARA